MDRRALLGALCGSATVGLSGCTLSWSRDDDTDNDTHSTDETDEQGTDENGATDLRVMGVALVESAVESNESAEFGETLDWTFAKPPESMTVAVDRTVDFAVSLGNRGERTATQTVELTLAGMTDEQTVTVEGNDTEGDDTENDTEGDDTESDDDIDWEALLDGFLDTFGDTTIFFEDIDTGDLGLGTHEYTLSTADDEMSGTLQVVEQNATNSS